MAGGAAIFGGNEEFSCNGTAGDAILFCTKNLGVMVSPKTFFINK
jgi:hypothetical protein